MPQQPVPVDEIVGLLAKVDPIKLNSLKNSHPDQQELFKAGIVAGPQRDSSLRLKAEIALAGMQAIVAAGGAQIRKLQKRMTLGHRLKLGAQVLTILASSTVLGLLKSEAPPIDQYVAAMVGVLSAILSLLSDNVSKSGFSSVTLERVYSTLVKQQTTAEQIADDLVYSVTAEDFTRVTALIRRANVCSAAIKEALLTA
jgi:hypothetical protein